MKYSISYVALYFNYQRPLKIAVCLHLYIFMRGRRCKIHPRGKIYRYEIGVSFTVQFFLRQCNSRWSCCSYNYKAQISDINPKSTRSAIQRRCLINSLDNESNLKVLHIFKNCYNTVDRKNHSIYLEEITIQQQRSTK